MEKRTKTLEPIYNGCTPLNISEEELVALGTKFGIEITENSIRKIPSISEKLKNLKDELTSTDYQVIKCYEYSLAGIELPYNIETLHTEREAIREQIRELEEQI